jgi:hypothetical protein
VIETNICAAEVLKHQLPEAQGAIILRGLGQTYTNAENRGHAGDSHRRSDDRTPQRAQAQRVDRNSSPECGRPSSRVPGVAFIKLETFDDTSWLDPRGHIYCDSKEQWTPMPEGSQVVC